MIACRDTVARVQLIFIVPLYLHNASISIINLLELYYSN